jgi:hypothetical protein
MIASRGVQDKSAKLYELSIRAHSFHFDAIRRHRWQREQLANPSANARASESSIFSSGG